MLACNAFTNHANNRDDWGGSLFSKESEGLEEYVEQKGKFRETTKREQPLSGGRLNDVDLTH